MSDPGPFSHTCFARSMDRRNCPRAEAELREALSVSAQTLPDTNSNVAIALVKLGRVLLREQQPAAAEDEA